MQALLISDLDENKLICLEVRKKNLPKDKSGNNTWYVWTSPGTLDETLSQWLLQRKLKRQWGVETVNSSQISLWKS